MDNQSFSRQRGILPLIAVYSSFAFSLLVICVCHAQNVVAAAHESASEMSAAGVLLEVMSSFIGRLSGGPTNLTTYDLVFLGSMSMLAFELLDFISKRSGVWLHSEQIPVRGKHLDDLRPQDLLFIGLSKAATAPFVYFYTSFAFQEPNVIWGLSQINVQNTLLALVSFFVVYDFFYTLLHWALHIKAIYGFVHKHHHHQKAPSRANVDAINVHPLEYFLGEYNHLFTVYLCTRVMPVHVVSCFAFLGIGGLLAGINHTRFDVHWSLCGVQIYDSKVHDVHHRIPQSNYGQYTMFWDRVFGTYRYVESLFNVTLSSHTNSLISIPANTILKIE